MNERIEELIKQADYNAPGGQWKEYFAELIIKECSYLADQAHYKATNGKSAGGYIRQQFGVEE